jgi:hypothetical protein
MRETRSVRLSSRERARVRAASAEAGVPAATFLREAAVEVADRVLRGQWQPEQRDRRDGRVLEFRPAEQGTRKRQ